MTGDVDANDLSALGESEEGVSQSASGDLDNVRSSVTTLPTSHSKNPNDGEGEKEDAAAAADEGKEEGKEEEEAKGAGEGDEGDEGEGKEAGEPTTKDTEKEAEKEASAEGSDDDYGSEFEEEEELDESIAEVSRWLGDRGTGTVRVRQGMAVGAFHDDQRHTLLARSRSRSLSLSRTLATRAGTRGIIHHVFREGRRGPYHA